MLVIEISDYSDLEYLFRKEVAEKGIKMLNKFHETDSCVWLPKVLTYQCDESCIGEHFKNKEWQKSRIVRSSLNDICGYYPRIERPLEYCESDMTNKLFVYICYQKQTYNKFHYFNLPHFKKKQSE